MGGGGEGRLWGEGRGGQIPLGHATIDFKTAPHQQMFSRSIFNNATISRSLRKSAFKWPNSRAKKRELDYEWTRKPSVWMRFLSVVCWRRRGL